MEQNYGVARFVFGLLSLSGWVLLTFSPLWLLLFGALGAVLGPASPFGGLLMTFIQSVIGLALIATSQLGQAQIAIAKNTAAILSLMTKDAETPRAPGGRREPALSKEAWREAQK